MKDNDKLNKIVSYLQRHKSRNKIFGNTNNPVKIFNTSNELMIGFLNSINAKPAKGNAFWKQEHNARKTYFYFNDFKNYIIKKITI